jgi:hypothetical protein
MSEMKCYKLKKRKKFKKIYFTLVQNNSRQTLVCSIVPPDCWQMQMTISSWDEYPRREKKSDCIRAALLSCRGCQMVYFQTKIPIWVIFWGPLIRKCWYILWPFGIFLGHLEYCKDICDIYDHLVHFLLIGYSFFRFWYHAPRKIWQPCFLLQF